jgi:bacteriorhodopsin
MDQVRLFQETALFVFVAAALFMAIKGQVRLTIIPAVAGIAYYHMLQRPDQTELYRYADWFITTPLMLAAILYANGFSSTTVGGLVLADVAMVYFGYKGAVEHNKHVKRQNFFWGCVAFVPILYFLFQSKEKKSAVYLTLIVWTLYPIVWYANEVRVLTEPVTNSVYSIMDVCAKVGLVFLLHE